MRTPSVALAVAVVIAAACGSDGGNDDDDDDGAKAAKTANAAVAPDAAPAPDPAPAPPPDAATDMIPLFEGEPMQPYRPKRERGRMVELTLRSTPPGAEAAVDGQLVGPTPTYWRGPLTGRAREFTFVKPDFAMARYRFVPTTNGVVHATLLPLMNSDPDAGPK